MKFYNRFGLLLFLIINFAMLSGEIDLPWEIVLFMICWLAGVALVLWPFDDGESENE